MWTPQNPICLPAEPQSTIVEFLSGPTAQAVTWVLVIIGWVVAQLISHRFAMRRTRRDEEGDIVSDVVDRVAEVRDLAVAYYIRDAGPDRETVQAQLRYKLMAVGSRITWLKTRKRKRVISLFGAVRGKPPRYYDVESELIALRQAVTDGDFDVPDRKAVPSSSSRIHTIWYASDQLIGTIQLAHDEAN
jgi:hypothetical protein